MRVLWIGGDEARHFHFAAALAGHCDLVGAIVQRRPAETEAPPADLDPRDAANVRRHAETRAKKELEYFGRPPPPGCETLEVTSATLNAPASAAFVRERSPDVALLFGPEHYRRLLRNDDMEVVCASRASEALEQLERQPAQVVVTDQRMPEMSGVDLLSAIRARYPDMVRMMLTGYTEMNVAVEAINRGAYDLLAMAFRTFDVDLDDDLRKRASP